MERSDRGVSVRLVVYDILGKEVSVLVNENQKPGNYEVTFEAKDLSSGIYFYTIKSGMNMLVGKMNLIK